MGFAKRDEREIDRINELQRHRFDQSWRLFEPPLPDGVPERLEKIVSEGGIEKDGAVLDVGTGTGILIPGIQTYGPSRIVACDLSEIMLQKLREKHPDVETFQADVKDMALPESSIDVVFINACYPNIIDKQGTFENLARIVKTGGRIVISHPLGKQFVEKLRRNAPYPLDNFPARPEAEELFSSFGFAVRAFIDEPNLYILVLSLTTHLPR